MNSATDFTSVAGVRANTIIEPQTREEFAAAITAAHERGAAIVIAGGGTELGLGAPPERLDTLVRTNALSRIVEYAPADLVVTVEAGMTLAALQAELGPHRQRLALDPPNAERATIGGLLATNAYGPLRTRFGTLRDAIVGISLIRADGTVVRGGGKVVKNVAGFDLPKLAVGSLGTLAAIATATLRLHPLPEVSRRLRIACANASDVRTFVVACIEAQLEPAALDAERQPDGRFLLDARFEGFALGTAEQLERAGAIARANGFEAHEIEANANQANDNDANDNDANDSCSDSARSRDCEVRSFGTVRIRMVFPPASLAAIDSRALSPLISAFSQARASVYPSAAAAFVGGVPHPNNDDAIVVALDRARGELVALGGHAVVTEMPASLRGRVDAWGTPPASFALMRRLKERFDPQRSFNPGRFVGGI